MALVLIFERARQALPVPGGFAIVLDLYNYSLLTIFLMGLAAILAASEIGRLFGALAAGRSADNASAPEDDNISTLESAVLGLLALMIAFTFAMDCRVSKRGAIRS
jgi:hypothetical protein